MRSRRPGRALPLLLALMLGTLLLVAGCGDTALGPVTPAAPAASTIASDDLPSATPTIAEATASPPDATPSPISPPPATPAPAGSAAAATPAATPTASPRPTPAPELRVGGMAYVAVTVATGWHSPTSPRTVDAPALANPVRIRAWLASLTRDQQSGLIGRVDTQVLLGDGVLITELRPGWAHVVVPDQATPLDRRGYPVWIPSGQLTPIGPQAPPTAQLATIITPTAWLENAQGSRLAEASFGTRLPVLGRTGARVRVALPGARSAWLPSASVSIGGRGDPALPPTPASIVATAKQFVGLRYLWGGTSGFGFDCSGIVYLVYRVHGITLPRDADPQSKVGASIAAALRRPADLLFFARNGVVHHVAIWVGGGALLEAPQVAMPVRVVTLTNLAYRNEVSVTRRVLD